MPNPLVDAATKPADPAAMPGGMPGAEPQKQVSIEEVKTAVKKQAAIDHKIQALLKLGKPVERKAAVNMCIQLVAEGVFSAEQMSSYLMTIPTDAVKVREWLENHSKKVEENLDGMIGMIHGQEAAPDEMPIDPNTMKV